MKRLFAVILLASVSLWAQSSAPAAESKPADGQKPMCSKMAHEKGDGKMECKKHKDAKDSKKCCDKCSKMKHQQEKAGEEKKS